MNGIHQGRIEPYLVGLLFGIALSANVPQTRAQPGPSFQGLGTLPGGPNPSPSSRANGISHDGLVVVGSSSHPVVTGTGVAVRWIPGSGVVENLVESLGGTTQSHAFAASADGSVVVGTLEFQFEAFRWTQGGGAVGLGDLPGGIFESSANDVSADGSVVVGTGCSQIDFEAFRWTRADGMVGLGVLPGGVTSHARGVSADGTVIVGTSISSNGSEAFRWTADEGMVGLGDLPGGAFNSGGADVSADGRVVVGSSGGPSGIEPFRWTLIGGMIGLGLLEGTDRGGASDVSDDGLVIVGNVRNGHFQNSFVPFIWDPINGMRDLRSVLENDLGLDLTGWDLFSVDGISGDGRVIVGTGNPPDPHKFIEGWMAVLNECGTDADCSDGLFCNGVETCVANVCVPGVDLCPAGDSCIEASRVCASTIPTLSQWSLIAMALLLTVAATCVLKQRTVTAR